MWTTKPQKKRFGLTCSWWRLPHLKKSAAWRGFLHAKVSANRRLVRTIATLFLWAPLSDTTVGLKPVQSLLWFHEWFSHVIHLFIARSSGSRHRRFARLRAEFRLLLVTCMVLMLIGLHSHFRKSSGAHSVAHSALCTCLLHPSHRRYPEESKVLIA